MTDKCNGECINNPNDIVWYDIDCPLHSNLSDGISLADIQKAGGRTAYLWQMANVKPPTPAEQKWLDTISEELAKS